ncbi:uncharacterized protein LOC123230134 isoform X2 [Mangifera indica]|uniref:uncharacterized protein LOC123230134 isoform X2 n=1 Tax=Mangifera indica TaxID=29780 RepID=UPI001CFC0B2F|nr:uncharacterized protein LOC123230134 isoform X2 [Mangifera indica]
MGSLGEEELDQMVRDYIESSDSHSSLSFSSSKPLHPSEYLTLQGILGKISDVEAEIQQKISMYIKNSGSLVETKNQRKWAAMRLKADGFEASLCKTTWDSSSCFSKESYEYIEVMVKKSSINGGIPTRLLVDIDFRSQFEVARPTQTYNDLVKILPTIFVGTEEKLREIISLISPAGEKSFKEKGLHFPPWRSANYMKAKWLSTNYKKLPLSSNQSEQKGNDVSIVCCPLMTYLAKGNHH